MLDIGIDKEIADDILKEPQIFSMRRGRDVQAAGKRDIMADSVYELITVTH